MTPHIVVLPWGDNIGQNFLQQNHVHENFPSTTWLRRTNKWMVGPLQRSLQEAFHLHCIIYWGIDNVKINCCGCHCFLHVGSHGTFMVNLFIYSHSLWYSLRCDVQTLQSMPIAKKDAILLLMKQMATFSRNIAIALWVIFSRTCSWHDNLLQWMRMRNLLRKS